MVTADLTGNALMRIDETDMGLFVSLVEFPTLPKTTVSLISAVSSSLPSVR
mgnify:CR=1 FL=1